MTDSVALPTYAQGREHLLDYLKKGELFGNDRRFLYKDSLRKYLVEAGLTHMAVARGWFGGGLLLADSPDTQGIFPYKEGDSYLYRDDVPFERTRQLLLTAKHLPLLYEHEEDDNDRTVILTQFQKLDELKKSLDRQHDFISLGHSWAYESNREIVDGHIVIGEKKTVYFNLNPLEQSRYDLGSFTLAELQSWSVDKGPIVLHSPENEVLISYQREQTRLFIEAHRPSVRKEQ